MVLAGTDAGSPGVEIGRGLHFELQCMAAARISAEQLLYMATIGNARALDAKHYAPTIEVGAPASFGLYARCPWRDIANLASLRQVWCSGRPVRAGEGSATTAEASFCEAAQQQQQSA
jgi:imidazolonepropionase-like amidohydrolase